MASLHRAPTIDDFVTAWASRFEHVVRDIASNQEQLYLEDARAATAAADADRRPYLETAIRFLEAREDTWSEPLAVEDVIADRSAYVRDAATRAAGAAGRLPMQRARELPSTLGQAYQSLTGIHLAAPRGTRPSVFFEHLAADLYYPSESDRSYEAFAARLPGQVELTSETFRRALGFAAVVEITVAPGKAFFSEFTNPETNMDKPSQRRYARLERAMEERLGDLFTITVGGQHVVEGQVFIVGRASDGSLAGLRAYRIWT